MYCDCFFVFSREKVYLFKKLVIFVETMNFRNFLSKFVSFKKSRKFISIEKTTTNFVLREFCQIAYKI